MVRTIVLAVLALCASAPALAQDKPDAKDSKAIQDCIKSKPTKPESCVGQISDPCLGDEKKVLSTIEMAACHAREQAVWDDILNNTYRRLNDKLDDEQRVKLREMQRAWIAYRDTTCGFHWIYYRGTIANPLGAGCLNEETARRALFLLGFLDNAEGK